MSALIWLHEDCLRADHPLFREAQNASATCFIWDDAYMAQMHYGLKRRVFIYETLAALPVDIYVGDSADMLVQLATHFNASKIITGKTPNPQLKEIFETLRPSLPVTTIADDAFVQMDVPPDVKRFFKYWNKAKKNAFNYDGRP